jgi:2-polyprenyl-6-methoxyphenol hydroxylase-like FAD-dependent oxidoreductase
MAAVADVVIVGGGIGGGALAVALAREGLGVAVLEARTEYEDRVRGESMHAWGLKEARDLGVEQVMLDAGAHITGLWKQYAEGIGAAGEIPVSMMVPDIPGTLNLHHPVACQALVDAASASGATVVRGVSDVKLTDGGVSYTVDGAAHEVRAPLVVGADGRQSTIRKQTGITLERQEPISYIAGLLLDGLDAVDAGHDVLAAEGDVMFVMFHQGDGRARTYLITGKSGQHRFAGKGGVDAFRAACNLSCLPWGEAVANGRPAGPVATYPGDDTWTATPYADGVVLIGDAAGHNDPIIGQGLSIAMRDARTVRDLVLEGARTPEAFTSYGAERMERMARLRFIADVLAVSNVEDAPNLAARRRFLLERMGTMDPEVMGILAGAFAGPETMPPDATQSDLLDRIRAA